MQSLGSPARVIVLSAMPPAGSRPAVALWYPVGRPMVSSKQLCSRKAWHANRPSERSSQPANTLAKILCSRWSSGQLARSSNMAGHVVKMCNSFSSAPVEHRRHTLSSLGGLGVLILSVQTLSSLQLKPEEGQCPPCHGYGSSNQNDPYPKSSCVTQATWSAACLLFCQQQDLQAAPSTTVCCNILLLASRTHSGGIIGVLLVAWRPSKLSRQPWSRNASCSRPVYGIVLWWRRPSQRQASSLATSIAYTGAHCLPAQLSCSNLGPSGWSALFQG